MLSSSIPTQQEREMISFIEIPIYGSLTIRYLFNLVYAFRFLVYSIHYSPHTVLLSFSFPLCSLLLHVIFTLHLSIPLCSPSLTFSFYFLPPSDSLSPSLHLFPSGNSEVDTNHALELTRVVQYSKGIHVHFLSSNNNACTSNYSQAAKIMSAWLDICLRVVLWV